MKIEIEILDRIYDAMEQFCRMNNLDLQEYVVSLVEDGFNIARYGDLNEKIRRDEPKRETEKPKPVEKTDNVVKVEKPKEEKPEEPVKVEETVENTVEKEEKPVTKTKRVVRKRTIISK